MDTKGVVHYPELPQGAQTHYQGFNMPQDPPPYDARTAPPYQHQPQPQPVQQIRTINVVSAMRMGPAPQILRCPSCQAEIQTRIDYEANTKTHLFAALICLLCWPCVWVPYVVDSCKSANHYCPNCGTYLGSYEQ